MPSSLVLRDYVAEMGRHTDAPKIYHYASMFSVIASLMTRYRYRVRLASGEPSKWMNSWTVLVGDSGIARKSTAISMATQVLERLDPEMVAPSDMSPEGFLNQLSIRNRDGKNNACTLLVASELSHVLAQFGRSYSGTLKPLLMELYDTEKNYKRALSKSTLEIPTPRVSLIGGIATELLPAYTDAQDWHGGFIGRCLVVMGKKESDLDRGRSVEPKVYDKFAAKVRDGFSAMFNKHKAKGRPRVDYDAAAGKLAGKFQREQLTHHDPDVRIVMARAPIHLMRVALVEQFDEDPESLSIGKGAVERAMKNLLEPWAKSLPNAVMECCARGASDFEGDRLARRIIRFVERAGGETTWGQAMRACALQSRAFKDAVAALEESGLLVVELPETEDGDRRLRLTDRAREEAA